MSNRRSKSSHGGKRTPKQAQRSAAPKSSSPKTAKSVQPTTGQTGASKYSGKWLQALRSSQLKSIGAWGASTISSSPESVTQMYNWTRVLEIDSVCSEAEFEVARLANLPTSLPCGYAVAIDVTGFDEWANVDATKQSFFRPAATQIYHIDMAHAKGRSLDHRIKWMAAVPAVEHKNGIEYPITIAPVEVTTYPDVAPSSTKFLSFGHTIKPSDRRMTFYKRYTDPTEAVVRYRKYMVVGIYSPLRCNGGLANVSNDVGVVDLTMQTRAFKEDSPMSGEYHRRPLPPVIDFPVYDPTELEGPLGDDTSAIVTIVTSSEVTIRAGGTAGTYYAYVKNFALDDDPRVGALYRLERPIMMNVAATSGGPPQPVTLSYFRWDDMTGGAGTYGYLFSNLHDAMECQPAAGYTADTLITTTYPVRMVKEVDASGIATARGRGMGNFLNVAHNGLQAPDLRRTPVPIFNTRGAANDSGFDSPGKGPREFFNLKHSSVMTPGAIEIIRGK